MSMNEPVSIQTTEDWCVVFQSIPSKHKNEVVKQMEKIFGLDKRDARDILMNAPLVFVDNLTFGLAARIKSYFQRIGVAVEITNHEIIKKNCPYISWPQTPDLSFFIQHEAGLAAVPAREEKNKVGPVDIPQVGRKPGGPEMEQETQKFHGASLPEGPAHELPVIAPHPDEPPPLDIDPELDRRIKEMGKKFGKIHEERRALQVQHAEAIAALRNEFQQRLEEEIKKSDGIAKAYEELQQEVKKLETLCREGEAFRSRTATLDEKVRELEAVRKEKSSEIELLVQQREYLTRQSEKIVVETQQELATLRNRELEFLKKIEGLERTVQKMTASLQARDSALAQLEEQIAKLAG